MKNGETKLSLEDYLLLYRHPSRSYDLHCRHLNQIIEMHGFYKCHHKSKAFLVHSVHSLDLAPPTRSTLYRAIPTSPSAALTADEAAADVEALGWNECPVRSLYTLNSEAEISYLCGGTAAAAAGASSTYAPLRRRRAPPAEFAVARRPRSKRKRISINALGPADFRSPPLPACYPLPMPPPPESPPPHSPSMPRSPTPPPPSSPPPLF